MRILLADDHALFRAGLTSLLTAWGFQVVGEAGDGEEAVAKARALCPDVVFMDITMPNANGLAATRAIKAEHPHIRVVILTVSDDEQDLFEAVKSGAEGYLLKNLQEQEFADLVSRLSRGEPTMSPGLARKLLREFARLKATERHAGAQADLTDREREVLEMVASGASNREIAATLYISEHTVHYHNGNILSKLHIRNRAEVVAWALQHGFTPRPAAEN